MTSSPDGKSLGSYTYARITNDGWENILTGAGTAKDSKRAMRAQASRSMPRAEREALYATGGVARRIIDVPCGDMVREWFDLVTEDGVAIQQEMDALGIKAHVDWALKCGRLQGGSMLLLLIDDGGTLEDELNENQIRRIYGARVYDREELSRRDFVYDDDPMSASYGYVEWYSVQPARGRPFFVHASRVIMFPGLRVPNRLRELNDGWDYSYYDLVYAALQNHETGMNSATSILGDFVQATLSVKGLTDLIAAGQDDVIKKRLNLLDLSRNVLNTMILDADEEQYTKHASSVAGLADVLDRNAQEVSAITGIPITRLYGRSPGGMNATGESDIRNYYDELGSEQESILSPRLERLVRLFMLQRDGTTQGREPSEWAIKWRPLWQPTEKEQAETRKAIADTDVAYIDRGVVTPAEVALTRFGGGEYNPGPITLDESDQRDRSQTDE